MHACEELVACFLDDLGSGVVGFVDAVAESVEEAFGLFDALDGLLGGFAAVDDVFKHVNDHLVCSAVQGSPEGADAGGNGGVEVYVG